MKKDVNKKKTVIGNHETGRCNQTMQRLRRDLKKSQTVVSNIRAEAQSKKAILQMNNRENVELRGHT